MHRFSDDAGHRSLATTKLYTDYQLWEAACEGDLVSVRRAIEAGADVNYAVGDGRTPLYTAAFIGHDAIVETLLAAGANVDLAMNVGATPLYVAACNGHVATVEKLLAAGATIDVATNDGFPPLFMAAQNGHDTTIEKLLEAGANINRVTNVGSTALYAAAHRGLDTTVNKLLAAGADIHVATNHGNTVLLAAVESGRITIVRNLLELGVNVDVVNSDGDSALLCAALHGHAAIARVLVEAGADISIRNNQGKTAADVFEKNGNAGLATLLREYDPSTKTFLRAIERGNLEVVRRLATIPSLVSARGEHARTPLHLAAMHCQIQMIDVLVQNGAKVDVRDDNGRTPLHVVCTQGNIDVMGILLEKRANPGFCDDRGLSCVDISALNGHLDAVKLLMDRGVSLTNRPTDGQTILHLGVIGRNESVIELLLTEATVDVNAVDDQGLTPLHYAVEMAHESKPSKESDSSAASPTSAPDAHQLAVLRLLLSTDGINVNAQDRDGRSALLIASQHGNLHTIRLLLDHGARVDIADKTSRTPLSVTAAADVKTVLQLVHNRQQYHDRCFELLTERDPQPSPAQLSNLVPLITSVFDLRLLFTLASQSSDRACCPLVLKSAFTHVVTNKLTFDDDACVFFKLVLNRCTRDGVISEADAVLFDRKAEKINTESADWVVEIKRQVYTNSWRLDAHEHHLRSVVESVRHVHSIVLENRAAIIASEGRVEELQSQVAAGKQLLGKLMMHAKHTADQVAHLEKRLIQTDDNIQHVAQHLTHFRDAYLSRLQQEQKIKRIKMICGIVASVAGFVIAPVLKEISDAVVDLTNPIDIVSTLYGERDIAAFLAETSQKTLSDVARNQLEKYAIDQDEFETILREEIASTHPEIVVECERRGLALQVDGGRSELVKSELARSLETEECAMVELLRDLHIALRNEQSQIQDTVSNVHSVSAATIQCDVMASLALTESPIQSAVTAQMDVSTLVRDEDHAWPTDNVIEDDSTMPSNRPNNEAHSTAERMGIVESSTTPFHTAVAESGGDLSSFKALISAISTDNTDATAPAEMQLRTTRTARENLCAVEYAYARGYFAVGDMLATLMPTPPPSFNTTKAVSVELLQPIDAFAFVCVVDQSHGDVDECAELCELVDDDDHAVEAAIEANVTREFLETVMWTPVEYACHLGYVDIVKCLLKDVNKKMPTSQKIELLKRTRDRAAAVGAAA